MPQAHPALRITCPVHFKRESYTMRPGWIYRACCAQMRIEAVGRV